MHQIAADAVSRLLWAVRPSGVHVLTAVTVRMPNGDGSVPDVVVTTANPIGIRQGLPADQVHTVVEVVSPSNALVDRAYKRELYAEAGIPCYWRVELEAWRGYEGPLPLVVARVLTPDGWQSVDAPAGVTTGVPLAIGRDGDKTITMTVPVDPAVLVEI